MLRREVLVGGGESGGIGFGMHLPERDALFASLLLLEALKDAGDVRLRQAQVKNAEAEAKFAAERRSNSELTLQNEKRITELQNEGALAAQRRDQKALHYSKQRRLRRRRE